MGLDLGDCVDSHTDNDEQGGAAKVKRYVQLADQQGRHNAHSAQINGADNCEANQGLVKKFGGFFTWSDTRDEPTVLLQVFCDIIGLKGDRRIKKAEKDDHTDEHDVVIHRSRRERGGNLLDPVDLDERPDGCGKHHDRGGKNRWNNPRNIDLQRQVGGLTTINPIADHTLGVLDGDATLGGFHENDEPDDGEHQRDDNGDKDEREFPGLDQLDGVDDSCRHARNNTGEDNERYTITDTALRHLLTQPHDERRPGGQGQHRHQLELHSRIEHNRTARRTGHAFQARGDEETLHDGEQNGAVAGVLGYFTATRLPFLGQGFQLRHNHCQQLDDDRCRNIRHDAQGEDGEVLQRTAGEHVEHAEQCARILLEKSAKRLTIDTGRRDLHPHPVDKKHQESENHSLA